MRALASLIALLCLTLASRADARPYAPVDALHADVTRRIAAGQFEDLLQDTEQAQKSQQRLPDGRWRLAILYGGLRDGFRDAARGADDWDRFQAQLVTLTTHHPDSSNAWLMLASLHEAHAWGVRGTGYANSVNDANFARFHALLEQARTVLDKHHGLLKDNPQARALRIAIGGAAGDDPAELDAAFAEALRKSPNYHQAWFERLRFLTPQWGGSIDQMAAFIATASSHPSASDGNGMTARLLWIAQEFGHPDLARRPEIDWNAVRKSYDDVLDRFPDRFNAIEFALQACGKADKAETARLLARVKPEATPDDLGGSAGFFRACQDWTSGKVPNFVLRDPSTGKLTVIK